MKMKLLISITSQFGYHTDTYMYCKYLDKTKYEVHYVGFDQGYSRRDIDNVHIHYIPLQTDKIKRYWIYLTTINRLIRDINFDFVFQVDHKMTFLVRLCNLRCRFILDIRTGYLKGSRLKRAYYNAYIYFTSLFYRRVTIISESLRKLLHIPAQKTTIIPLGAEVKNCSDKSFENLYLFYIGTLEWRNIEETVEGLALFIKKHPGIIVTYDIVGTGKEEDMLKIKQIIVENNMQDIVVYHGQKNHNEIGDIWERCNLGIAYLPITPYYDCQPTTKLYEYLLAGMPVIATNTFENRREISLTDGVLIQDNKESFASGLETFIKNKQFYNSMLMREKFIKSSWQNIVQQKLEPYLDQV